MTAKDALRQLLGPAIERAAAAKALMTRRDGATDEEYEKAAQEGFEASESLVRDTEAVYAELERTAFALMGEKCRPGESLLEFCQRIACVTPEAMARYMNKNRVAYWFNR